MISKGIPILPEEFLSQIQKGTVSDTIRRLELVPTKSKVYFMLIFYGAENRI